MLPQKKTKIKFFFCAIYLSILILFFSYLFKFYSINVKLREYQKFDFTNKINSLIFSVDAQNLIETIKDLQSFKERQSHEKQEQTAQYLLHKLDL